MDYGAAPFVAYRIFGFNEKQSLLTSLTRVGQNRPWMPGEIQHSMCTMAPNHGHGPPHLNCSCGIWAVKSRRLINYAYPEMAAHNLAAHERARREREPVAIVVPSGMTGTTTFTFRGGTGSPTSPFVYNFGPKFRPPLMLSARVFLWGVVHEHQYGYRAEYAKIIPETIRWWPRRGRWFKPKLLSHIIDKYTIAEWFGADADDETSSGIPHH